MWKWVDPPRSRRVEPVRSEGWGVHRQRQRMGVVVGRGGVYAQGPCSSKGCPQCFKSKRAIVVCASVCACVPVCACVRGARGFVCVVAAECLWDPLVEGGIIIVTTTTATSEDDLDYTATTAATPRAALAGNR